MTVGLGGSGGPSQYYPPELYEMLTSMNKQGLLALDPTMMSMMERIQKGEPLTTSDIEFLKTNIQLVSLIADIVAPTLPAPDQKLIGDFLASLQGGAIPISTSTGNAYLNCSAILTLFIMTAMVITTMSEIQLAENLKKAALALVQKDMAIAAANATIAAGEAAAEKERAQEAKAIADAAMALTQVITTCAITIFSKIEFNKQLSDVIHSPTRIDPNTQKPYPSGVCPAASAEERLKVQQHVDTQMQFWKGTTEGIINMMKSSYEAAMHKTLAQKDIEEATQRALSELFSKLIDNISQSAQMLGKSADNDCAKTIQSLLENFAAYLRTWTELGHV